MLKIFHSNKRCLNSKRNIFSFQHRIIESKIWMLWSKCLIKGEFLCMRDANILPTRLIRFCGSDCSNCDSYKRFMMGDESGLVNIETNYRCCWLPRDYPRGKDCEIRACCEEKGILFCGECGQFEGCIRMKVFYSKPGYDTLRRRMLDEVKKRKRE